MSKIDLKEYVKRLGFEVVEFREKFEPSGAIFKASDGDLVTIKFGCYYDTWGYKHVTKENKVLDRMRGVEGIVKKLSFHEFEDPKLAALVRRYVEGNYLRGSNRDWLANKDILINAVEELHRQGISHLDLKRSNIVIDPTKKPHIIDLTILPV